LSAPSLLEYEVIEGLFRFNNQESFSGKDAGDRDGLSGLKTEPRLPRERSTMDVFGDIMIRRFIAVGLFLIGMYAVPASALQRIELLDGTILQGEILSFDGSAYAVRTENLGTMKIEKSKVRSIQMGGTDSQSQQAVQDLRSRMLTNPTTLGMIMELQNDPDVQEVLNDPEIVSAAEAGDFEKLLSNPKFMKLLQNPAIQEIGRGLLK
jgi:hypothetical protein